MIECISKTYTHPYCHRWEIQGHDAIRNRDEIVQNNKVQIWCATNTSLPVRKFNHVKGSQGQGLIFIIYFNSDNDCDNGAAIMCILRNNASIFGVKKPHIFTSSDHVKNIIG